VNCEVHRNAKQPHTNSFRAQRKCWVFAWGWWDNGENP